MLLQWRSGGCFVYDMPIKSRPARQYDGSMWWAEGSLIRLNSLLVHIPYCTMWCLGVLDLMTTKLQLSVQTKVGKSPYRVCLT